jgi:hypothetical protein
MQGPTRRLPTAEPLSEPEFKEAKAEAMQIVERHLTDVHAHHPEVIERGKSDAFAASHLTYLPQIPKDTISQSPLVFLTRHFRHQRAVR